MRNTAFFSRFQPHLPIVILSIVFALLSIVLLTSIPYGSSPDEETHFHYNVEFMLQHHRLPVSGIDDLDAYKTCRNNDNGRQTCANSYNVFPAFGYVISALSSAFWKLFGIGFITGARLAATAWGTVFLISIFYLSLDISESVTIATLLSFSVCFIPQVIFISTYTNSDMHSLAISSLIGLTGCKLYLNICRKNIVAFALAFGLLFSMKYNYFVYFPFCLLFLASLYFLKKVDLKQCLQITALCVLTAFFISGLWFVRNLYLYKDPLGLSFAFSMMDKFHPPGVVRPFDFESLGYLHEHRFFWVTFQSLIAVFGYMTIYLTSFAYLLYFSVFSICMAVFLYCLKRLGNPRLWQATALLLIFFSACLFQTVWNSLKVDLQPQGRYLFPVLVPFVMWVSALAKQEKLVARVVSILSLNTFWILIMSGFFIFSNYSLFGAVR